MKNLPIITKIIEDAYHISIELKSQHTASHPLSLDTESLVQAKDPQYTPLLRTTNFLESFVVYHTEDQTLMIGPFSANELSEHMITGMMHDYHISESFKHELLAYYAAVPWLNQKQIIDLCYLLHYLMCAESLDEKIIRRQLMHPEEIEKTEATDVDNLLQKQRLAADFQMNYEVEQKIWAYVKAGDKEKLLHHFDTIKLEGLGTLSKKSHMRNCKNQTIIYIALAARAAIEGGLYPEIAYTMSNEAIQQVEETTTLQHVYAVGDDFLYAILEQLNDYKGQEHSDVIGFCKQYIFKYIFDDISIQGLAEKVHLNPIYLSQLFKKETKQPLGQYIQDAKIKEAEKLLIQSNESIIDICMLLHFNNQSHFSSIFKKHTGSTPGQYRKKHRLLHA